MSVYLDASVLVALFIADALSVRATAAVSAFTEPPIVSDYASLELSSSLMRMVRADAIALRDAKSALDEFDAWVSDVCHRAETSARDVAAAARFVRQEKLSLRTSDAVHAAITKRLGASLMTFDKKLASNARRLGVAIA